MADFKKKSKEDNGTKQVSFEQWDKANLSNRFMFRLVMEAKDIYKEILELLLDMIIAEIS